MTQRNLSLYRGETRSFSGVLKDDDGNAIDLTSAVLTWRYGDRWFTQEIATLTESDGITTPDATNGKWKVTIPTSATAEQIPTSYRHQGEAQIGQTRYIFTSGRLELRPNIR